MTNIFRLVTCSCLIPLMSFAGLQLQAKGDGPAYNVGKIRASALQVEMIQSNEITLPAEFQAVLYENLIQQLGKKAAFLHIYRDGDHNADDIPDLVILHSTIRGFKEGSERMRQVTTVAGATSITIHCQFTDRQDKVLLERDVKGKVQFLGGNLRATYDFAKKAATITRDNFTATGPSQPAIKR